MVRTFHQLDALAAVVELDPALRSSIRAQYPHIPVFDDVQDVLNSPISALAIATPAPVHFSVAMAALQADKDVFIEKPMTLNTEDAVELTRVAAERNRILMVGHLLLYQPAIQWIKSFIDAGELGTLHSIHQERLGLGIARRNENVLWNLGVHDLAVALFLLNDAPERIHVAGQCVLQPHVDDDIYLHMEFAEGRQLHLHVSWLWPEKRRRLTVIGSKGMLVYNELEQSVDFHRKGIGEDLANWDDGVERVYQGQPEPLKLELQHFLGRLKDRTPPLTDGRHAIEVIRILEKASSLLEPALKRG